MENNLHNLIRANWDRIRAEKGLKMQDLANKLGVTRQTIYSYFRPGCSINTIQKAADLIGVDPAELLKKPVPGTGTRITCPHCHKDIFITVDPGTGDSQGDSRQD